MDPLDSTAILNRAVDSLVHSSAGPRSARPAELGTFEVRKRIFPPRAETEQTPQPSSRRLTTGQPSRLTSGTQSFVFSTSGNPREMIRKAEEVLQIATMSGSSAVFRRQIASAAYLAEIEAQMELARLQREGSAAREWFA